MPKTVWVASCAHRLRLELERARSHCSGIDAYHVSPTTVTDSTVLGPRVPALLAERLCTSLTNVS